MTEDHPITNSNVCEIVQWRVRLLLSNWSVWLTCDDTHTVVPILLCSEFTGTMSNLCIFDSSTHTYTLDLSAYLGPELRFCVVFLMICLFRGFIPQFTRYHYILPPRFIALKLAAPGLSTSQPLYVERTVSIQHPMTILGASRTLSDWCSVPSCSVSNPPVSPSTISTIARTLCSGTLYSGTSSCYQGSSEYHGMFSRCFLNFTGLHISFARTDFFFSNDTVKPVYVAQGFVDVIVFRE
ncbi:unnamed protein product [Somion occarium]|uniref:Uncharacterized protein n=1 Tax=Somion occarium TaxID=3059160 RepID=A0ABP1D1R7_9APHY